MAAPARRNCGYLLPMCQGHGDRDRQKNDYAKLNAHRMLIFDDFRLMRVDRARDQLRPIIEFHVA